ncbi:MAG TPA: hypothetical protein VMV91_07535 [Rhodocyclaceae bacterium]|nr:hypothetical protein [Rhodocyclaceae bacterium]
MVGAQGDHRQDDLSLSRAESGYAIRDGEAVALQALAHEVLIELAGLAEARGIDLGLAPDDPDGGVLAARHRQLCVGGAGAAAAAGGTEKLLDEETNLDKMGICPI